MSVHSDSIKFLYQQVDEIFVLPKPLFKERLLRLCRILPGEGGLNTSVKLRRLATLMGVTNYFDIDRIDDKRKVELASFLDIMRKLDLWERAVALLETKTSLSRIDAWLEDRKEFFRTDDGFQELMKTIEDIKTA